MAVARLINPRAVEGGTAYLVEATTLDEAAFTGPEHRDWSDFVIVPGVGAKFRWRTGADRVRAAATMVASGALSVEGALKEPAVAEWVERCGEDFLLAFEDEEPWLRDLSDDAFAREMLTEVGVHVRTGAAGFAYYAEDDDSVARDAAACLALPPWARVSSSSAGGPGTGYTEVAVVIEDGWTLDDLARLLEQTE